MGVALAEADQALSPTLLPARTCTWYAVSLVSPVMVALVEVLVLLAFHSVQAPQSVSVGLVEQVRSALLVQARYCTS